MCRRGGVVRTLDHRLHGRPVRLPRAVDEFVSGKRRRPALAAICWGGERDAAQQQIKACYNLLPDDIEVAIDIVPDLEKLGRKKEADAMFAECFATQQELCVRFPDSANQHNQIAWLAAKCNRELDSGLQHAKSARWN